METARANGGGDISTEGCGDIETRTQAAQYRSGRVTVLKTIEMNTKHPSCEIGSHLMFKR